MHASLPNNNSASFFPLRHTPGRAIDTAAEVQLASQRPLIPLHMDLVLHDNRDTIERAERLIILISLRRGLSRSVDSFSLRLQKRSRVDARRVGIATDQREQSLDNRGGSHLARQIAGMIIDRSIIPIVTDPLLARRR